MLSVPIKANYTHTPLVFLQQFINDRVFDKEYNVIFIITSQLVKFITFKKKYIDYYNYFKYYFYFLTFFCNFTLDFFI